MPDRLVQEHAGPSGSQHHRHRPGGRVLGLEAHERASYRLSGVAARAFAVAEVAVVVASAASRGGLLPTSVLLHDDAHVEAHERAHVRGEGAVARDVHDARIDAAQAYVHLFHPRIQPAGESVD